MANSDSEELHELPDFNAKTWEIKSLQKANFSLFGATPKNRVPEEKLNSLWAYAFKNPDAIKKDLLDLEKDYPEDPELRIIFAICIFESLKHDPSADKVPSLKKATEYMAAGMAGEKLSIYNAESFLVIYFDLIKNLRKYNAYIRSKPSGNIIFKSTLYDRQKVIDLLDSPRNLAIRTLRYLQAKLGKELYTSILTEKIRKKAFKNYSEKNRQISGVGNAQTIVFALYSVLSIFVQIPILKPYVDRILNQFPDDIMALNLMKGSLLSSQSFFKIRLEIKKEALENLKRMSSKVFEDNMNLLAKTHDHQVLYNYEADTYLNVSNAAELYSLFSLKKDYEPKILRAIEKMELLAKRDLTHDRKFGRSAFKKIDRLRAILIKTKTRT